MRILDGKVASKALLAELAAEVEGFVALGHRSPHLVAILVGNDGASLTYVNSKVRHCEQVGIRSSLFRLAADTLQEELIALVNNLNADADVDGFIVQLPLPKHLDERAVVMAIDPAKDVDGFHPQNVGRLTLGIPTFVSATPLGILEMLKYFHVPTSGKHAVVLGRSNIVGTPMSILLSRASESGNCTVTLCHSRTPDITDHLRRADIIVAAIGKPRFVTADMVKEGAVVIDVGITRVDDPTHPKGYTIRGDVDFENVAPHCSWVTPVPGGVGLMTIVALLRNTMQAYMSSTVNIQSHQNPTHTV